MTLSVALLTALITLLSTPTGDGAVTVSVRVEGGIGWDDETPVSYGPGMPATSTLTVEGVQYLIAFISL